ncbi:quinic acid utilization activator [Apiospora sp. TS-2023a]
MSDEEAEDGRASKKRKASRACDRCNLQHQPCDNATPKCSVCDRAGTECTYNRPVRKRGPRTGYTAQYGERLWGLVLQANPAIEDMILRTLATGTYRDTGITNADYFRNNDNQAELVSYFTESRLGRFVQAGDLPDIRDLPPPPSSLQLGNSTSEQHTPDLILPRANGQHANSEHGATVAAKDATPKFPQLAPIVSSHGAPQNPGEIYTQSDDIRRAALSDFAQVDGPGPTSQTHPTDRSGWQTEMSPIVSDTTSAFARSALDDSHDAASLYQCPIPMGVKRNPSTFATPSASHGTPGSQSNGESSVPHRRNTETDLDFASTYKWYDSVPTDTLLNLGFVAGEGMAEDFFDLCENPDPVDNTEMSPTAYNEDEETVWRRLVMRGRFV